MIDTNVLQVDIAFVETVNPLLAMIPIRGGRTIADELWYLWYTDDHLPSHYRSVG